MSWPENPLGSLGPGDCSATSACSVMRSKSTCEAAWGEDILRIKGFFHTLRELKVLTRRSPHAPCGGFYIRWAPFQHRRRGNIDLGACSKSFRNCGCKKCRRVR